MLRVAVTDEWRLAVAVAIGLLIGADRERHKGTGRHRGPAGIRTFALVSLLGGICAVFGEPAVLVLGGAFVGAMALAAYARQRTEEDPGITTEISLVVAFLLGALAVDEPGLAGALGVIATVLLSARHQLHRLVRDVLTEGEMRDALVLAAAAVVALPLVPDRGFGPGGSLNPFTVWRLAVIVMAVSACGYVGVRLLGPRFGLPFAAVASGFVSGIATIAAMGSRARAEPELARAALAGAVLSNASTGALTLVLVGSTDTGVLRRVALPLGAAVAIALALGVALARRAPGGGTAPGAPGRAFDLRVAATFALGVSAVLAGSAFLAEHLGGAGLVSAAAVTGFADSHAAAISAAAVAATGRTSAATASVAILAALATNTVTKLVVARVSGGAPFARRIAGPLAAFIGTAWALAALVR